MIVPTRILTPPMSTGSEHGDAASAGDEQIACGDRMTSIDPHTNAASGGDLRLRVTLTQDLPPAVRDNANTLVS